VSTYRIEYDIARQLQQIDLFLHQDGLVATLKDVTDPVMNLVEALGVDAIELAHAFDEVAIGSFDDQMVMVSHLTISVDGPVEALADLPRDLQTFRSSSPA
jgi:hypothetical protein